MKNLNLTYYLMISLFITIFLLFRQCGKTDTVIESIKNNTSTVQIDTIIEYVKGVPDTIHDTVSRWYPKMIPYYAGDTTTSSGDSVSLYITSIEDSLISGEFTSSVKGELLFSDFKYKAKFPKYVFRTDTFKINTKQTITKDPWEFYIGGVIGGNESKFNLQPAALVRVPNKRLIIGYGYGLIDKTHNIHIFTKLKWD